MAFLWKDAPACLKGRPSFEDLLRSSQGFSEALSHHETFKPWRDFLDTVYPQGTWHKMWDDRLGASVERIALGTDRPAQARVGRNSKAYCAGWSNIRRVTADA